MKCIKSSLLRLCLAQSFEIGDTRKSNTTLKCAQYTDDTEMHIFFSSTQIG